MAKLLVNGGDVAKSVKIGLNAMFVTAVIAATALLVTPGGSHVWCLCWKVRPEIPL